MRLQQKSYSKLGLSDILRRRRSNLKSFLSETGIVTYELLKTRCNSMGVIPPSDLEFKAALGNPVTHNVSSPTEGIVVLEPPASNASDESFDNSEDLNPAAVVEATLEDKKHQAKPSKKKKLVTPE